MTTQPKQEKAIDAAGEPVQGPQEKAGKDEVKAELSFFNLGVEHAKQATASDEKLSSTRTTVREALAVILKAPQDSWPSYRDGFKEVLDARKKEGKPTMALAVLRSQISRILNAAKKQHNIVLAKVEDTKVRWEVLLKSLPKTDGKGRPEAEVAEPVTGISPETETNVGTLIQVIDQCAHRLVKIGREKDAPFAQYIGMNILEGMKLAKEEFQQVYSEYNTGGIVKDKAGLMHKLGLADRTPQAAAAAVAA